MFLILTLFNSVTQSLENEGEPIGVCEQLIIIDTELGYQMARLNFCNDQKFWNVKYLPVLSPLVWS